MLNSKRYNLVLCLGLIICCAGRVQAKVIKVPAEFKSIQKAIDSAAAGDEVLVAPGIYYETIILKPWVALRSEGTEEEHLNHSAARRTTIDANGVKKPVIEGADGAVVDGFTLTGLGKVDHHVPGHPHGVQNRGTSSIIINNIIHHMGSTGIGSHMHRGKVAAPYIANNLVYSNHGLGIGSNHDSAATIIGNIVYNNEELGIGSKNGAHPLIQDNIVYSNGWSGIGTKDGAFPIIKGNKVYNNGLAHDVDNAGGMVVGNTQVPLVENNEVYSNYTIGIGLGRNVVALVRNNESYGNRLVGIALGGTKDVKLVRNKIHNNDKVGIGIHSGSTVEIIENEIYSNMFNAFSPYNPKKNNVTLIRNKVRNNGLYFSGQGEQPRRRVIPGMPMEGPIPAFMQHRH